MHKTYEVDHNRLCCFKLKVTHTCILKTKILIMLNIMGILLFGVYQHSHGSIFTPILNKHSPAACYSSIISLSLWIHLQSISVCRMEALWCCGLWTWKEANCDSSCGSSFRENRLSAVRAHKNIVMYSLSLFILSSSSSIPVFSVKYLCLSVHFLGIKC